MRVRYRLVTYSASPAAEQQDIERLFHELWHVQKRLMPPGAEWRPRTDVYETAENVFVKMELAGVPEDVIEVTLYADHLVVTGTREDAQLESARDREADKLLAFYEAQITYGPFRSEVRLPRKVDSEHVTAELENGFLIITLPRSA